MIQLRRLGPRTQTLALNSSECDRVWIIGRGAECDVHTRSKYASRKHFSIFLRDNLFILKDYGSANGTYINEEKIDSKGEYVLTLGTVIGVGVPASYQNDSECFVFVFELKDLEESETERELIEESSNNSPPPEEHVPAIPSNFKNQENFHEATIIMNSSSLEIENKNSIQIHKDDNLIPDNQKLLYLKTEITPMANSVAGSPSTDTCNEGYFFETSEGENGNTVHFKYQNIAEASTNNNLITYSLKEEPIEISDSEDEWTQISDFKNPTDNSAFIKSEQDYEYDDDEDDDLFIDCIIPFKKTEISIPNSIKGDEKLIDSDQKCVAFNENFKNKDNDCKDISDDENWISLITKFADEIDQVLNFEDEEAYEGSDCEAILLDEEMTDADDDVMIVHTKLKNELKSLKWDHNKDADIQVIENIDILECNSRNKNVNNKPIKYEKKIKKRKMKSKVGNKSNNNDIEEISPLPLSKKRRTVLEGVEHKLEESNPEPDILMIKNMEFQGSENSEKRVNKMNFEIPNPDSVDKNKMQMDIDCSTSKTCTDRSAENENKCAQNNATSLKMKINHNDENPVQSDGVKKVIRAEVSKKRSFEVSIDEETRGIDEEKRGIDEEKRGINEEKRGINEEKRGINEEKRSIDEEKSRFSGNKVASKNMEQTLVEPPQKIAKHKASTEIVEAGPEARKKSKTVETAVLPDAGNKSTFSLCTSSDRDGYLRYKKIFYDILSWNANWLEESKNVPSYGLPPVFQSNLLQSIQRTFHNHCEYMNAFIPLLSLELWHSLSEKWKSFNLLANKRPAVCKFYENLDDDMICQFGNIGCDCLISINDNDMLWSKGSLVVIQLSKMDNEILSNLKPNGKMRKFSYHIFGYIVKRTVKNIDSNYSDPVIDKLCKNKTSMKIVKLDILVKSRPQLLLYVNSLIHLTPLHKMSTEKDLFKAVCSLHRSPLQYTILMPDRAQIALPIKVDRETIIFDGPLNCKQQELIWKLFHTCIKKPFGLVQIEGGPGTGKTYTIMAFVLQLLFSKTFKEPLRPKILYCSHSDVVVDEFTLKLSDYIQNTIGSTDKYKVVRFGNMSNMRPSITRMCSTQLAQEIKCRESAVSKIKLLDNKIKELTESLITPNNLTIDEIRKKRMDLHELKNERETIKNEEGSQKRERESCTKAEIDILEKADVISSTCYFSGSRKMLQVFKKLKSLGTERKIICIIDGAMQSKEAEAIIPLQLGVTHLIMLGDPRQLRATTKNEIVHSLGGNQSLFWRMTNIFNKPDSTPSPIFKLKIQYRMHPSISFLPKKIYYSDNLLDGIRNNHIFGLEEYLLLTCARMSNSSEDKSDPTYPYNMILTLMNLLFNFVSQKNKHCSLALITCDYEKAKSLKWKLLNSQMTKFEVLQIENANGREFDVVLFIFDDKMTCSYRANVALTRAKKSLIILTSDRPNKSNKFLERLMADASVRGFIRSVKPQMGNSELARILFKS